MGIGYKYRSLNGVEVKEIEHIASVLKKYQKLKGVSQGDLAELIGRTRTTVSRYLNGTHLISQDRLLRIIFYLEIPLEEFSLIRENIWDKS